jgi:hypothetical protein
MEIDIHQTDFVSFICETQGQVDGNRRFADPAFAAHHQDFVFDSAQGLGDGDILLRQAGVTRTATALLIAPAGTTTRTAHIFLQRLKKG